MPEFSYQFPSEFSTYLDDDADTVVTTTDVGHGYTDDGALSLQSAGSEAEGSGRRSSSPASHGMTMEEVERAMEETWVQGKLSRAAAVLQSMLTFPRAGAGFTRFQ